MLVLFGTFTNILVAHWLALAWVLQKNVCGIYFYALFKLLKSASCSAIMQCPSEYRPVLHNTHTTFDCHCGNVRVDINVAQRAFYSNYLECPLAIWIVCLFFFLLANRFCAVRDDNQIIIMSCAINSRFTTCWTAVPMMQWTFIARVFNSCYTEQFVSFFICIAIVSIWDSKQYSWYVKQNFITNSFENASHRTFSIMHWKVNQKRVRSWG